MTPEELPTTPQTVIRAKWGSELSSELWLTSEGTWVSRLGSLYGPVDFAQMLSFEVLASPAQKAYPFVDGPHLVIGPECFTGDGVEVAQTVISWRGENYYAADRAGLVLTQEEAALAVEAVSDFIQETYRPESLRRLGALAHKLDPDFPAPEDDDEDEAS